MEVAPPTYPTYNGRVDGMRPGETGAPFFLFSDSGRGVAQTMAADALRGMELNATAKLFMSGDNVEALQHGVRYGVFVRSGGRHTISRQSDTELVAVMRAMYLQHGRNTSGAPAGRGAQDAPDMCEVRRLNTLVLDYCVDRILTEVSMYLKYREDIQQLPVPMQRGEFASNKGTRSLRQVEF